MRFLVFFLVSFSILAAAYFYVGRRLIKPTRLSPQKKRLAWLGVVVWFLTPIIPFILFANNAESTALDLFSAIGYILLGMFTLVFTFVAIRDIFLGIALAVSKLSTVIRPKKSGAVDSERRRFLIHSSNIGIIGGAAVLTGYGGYQSHMRADIEEVEVPLGNLPREFDGFRIVQFTDIHAGPTIKRQFVEGVAHQISGLNADCLVFTGDLVDGSVSWLRDDVAPLKYLTAQYGKFFITGNHEYYSGVMPWIAEAGRLGFDVLVNEHRIIQRGSSSIVLAGVTDYSAGDFIPNQKSNPSQAFNSAPPGLLKILLAHQPRSIFEAAKAGVDFQISGHTHGGQYFPGNYLARLNQPYIKGLHKHGDTWIYVNRGTGYWGPPLRLGVPPEITVITLMKG